MQCMTDEAGARPGCDAAPFGGRPRPVVWVGGAATLIHATRKPLSRHDSNGTDRASNLCQGPVQAGMKVAGAGRKPNKGVGQ